MKNMLRLCFLILLILGLVACNKSSTSGKETDSGDQELADKLYFFNWGENIDPEIIDDFEEEFGVEVIYDTFSSNQEMYTKLNSGVAVYDIVVPTDYFVEKMIGEGLLQELNMDNIPNFENIEKVFHERAYDPGNKYSVPYLYGSIGIAYNKEKMDAPNSWNALWDTGNKGHVTVQADGQEVITMALQKLGHDIDNPSSDKLMEAKSVLEELNTNILAYDSAPAAKLISGEVWISQLYSDQAGIAMAENPDIDYLLPEEGGMLWMDNFVIPKTAPNKYTAEVFINYMLRPEVSKKLTDAIPSSNPNGAAKELMGETEKNNAASYPSIPETSVFFKETKPEILAEINKIFKEIKIK